MQWSDELSGTSRITEMRHRVQGNESVLTWKWPAGIDFVYVYLFPAEAEQPPEQRPPAAMKLYTREEYKAKAGYRGRLDGIGRYAYRVYPCVRKPEGIVVLRQEDGDNLIRFAAAKARIRYSIKTGMALFRKYQPVRIELTSEVAVPKEALCYVLKEGEMPLHPEDGTVYPFIDDIQPGRNVLPDIEIPKNSRIKLFFTDGKKYGELFELIPE